MGSILLHFQMHKSIPRTGTLASSGWLLMAMLACCPLNSKATRSWDRVLLILPRKVQIIVPFQRAHYKLILMNLLTVYEISWVQMKGDIRCRNLSLSCLDCQMCKNRQEVVNLIKEGFESIEASLRSEWKKITGRNWGSVDSKNKRVTFVAKRQEFERTKSLRYRELFVVPRYLRNDLAIYDQRTGS